MMMVEVGGAQCTLTFTGVDSLIGVRGGRELIFSILSNLIQNGIKFMHAFTEITVNAYTVADRILLDVKDHCGGLPPGRTDIMFLPFSQRG